MNHQTETGFSKTGFSFKSIDDIEQEKKYLERVNEYDYNKMIEDFTLRDKIAKGKKQHYFQLVETNKKYPGKVKEMQERVEQNEKDKIKRFEELYLEKSRNRQRSKEMIRKRKEENNFKAKELRREREDKVKKNLEIKLEEDEKNRLEDEIKIENRLKSFHHTLTKNKLSEQKEREEKNIKNTERHENNLKLRDERYNTMVKERDEKIFMRYTMSYWKKKEKTEEKKRKTKQNLEHLKLIKELLEEHEKRRIERQDRYIKKLNDIAFRRKLIEEKKRENYQRKIEVQNQKFLRTRENFRKNEEDELFYREEVLEKQRLILSRGFNKENALLLKKETTREKIILSHMEKGKRIMSFSKDLNKIKDKSIFKKSPEQRKQMYKELLRERAEKKKKEEEEKALNMK